MDVVRQASSKTEPPSLPRAKKAPRRCDSRENPHHYGVPKDRHRHISFEALELLYGEVKWRFEQSDLQLAQEIECLLLSAAIGNVTNF